MGGLRGTQILGPPTDGDDCLFSKEDPGDPKANVLSTLLLPPAGWAVMKCRHVARVSANMLAD